MALNQPINTETSGYCRHYRRKVAQGGAGGADPGLDPLFSSVVLLLNFDGLNGATTTVDSSLTPRSVALNGFAVLSTAQSKFGGSSLACIIGAQTQQRADVTIPGGEQADFPITVQNDMCVDFFVRPDALPGSQATMAVFAAGSGLIAIRLNTNGTVSVLYNFAGTICSSTAAVSALQWNHVAMVKDGTSWQVFVNGQGGSVGTYSYSGTNNFSFIQVACGTGSVYNNTVKGYYDHFRYTNAARYSADFTPPTAPATPA